MTIKVTTMLLKGLALKYSLIAFGLLTVFTLATAMLHAQTPQSASRRGLTLPNGRRSRARDRHRRTRLMMSAQCRSQPSFRESTSHSAAPLAQEAALQGLIAAQQNPASPLYQQWLTLEQFAPSLGFLNQISPRW